MIMTADISKDCIAFFGVNFPGRVNLTSVSIPEVGPDKFLHVQPEDGHYQAPKHVVVPYVENSLYSTNKHSYARRVHALYINYFIEHIADDEPHDYSSELYYYKRGSRKRIFVT